MDRLPGPLEWYHVGFAAAYGLGAGGIPVSGAPPALWAAGLILELSTALIVAYLLVRVVRRLDPWRPARVAHLDIPDSRYRFAVFLFTAAGLFVLGFATKPRAIPAPVLGVVLTPANGFLAISVAVDLRTLRTRGVDWGRSGYLYALGAIGIGAFAGLAYWYRRGRRRAASPDA